MHFLTAPVSHQNRAGQVAMILTAVGLLHEVGYLMQWHPIIPPIFSFQNYYHRNNNREQITAWSEITTEIA